MRNTYGPIIGLPVGIVIGALVLQQIARRS